MVNELIGILGLIGSFGILLTLGLRHDSNECLLLRDLTKKERCFWLLACGSSHMQCEQAKHGTAGVQLHSE